MSSTLCLGNKRPVVFFVSLEATLIEMLELPLARRGCRTVICETHKEFLSHDSSFEVACGIAMCTHSDWDWHLLSHGPAGSEGERIPIIYLMGDADVEQSVTLFKRGASDVFTIPVNDTQLTGAVEEAWRQHTAIRRARFETGGLRARLQTLTSREQEVLLRLLDGLSNKQIGTELKICERTVKAHRRAVMSKMRVQSLIELARRLERTGLNSNPEMPYVPPPPQVGELQTPPSLAIG